MGDYGRTNTNYPTINAGHGTLRLYGKGRTFAGVHLYFGHNPCFRKCTCLILAAKVGILIYLRLLVEFTDTFPPCAREKRSRICHISRTSSAGSASFRRRSKKVPLPVIFSRHISASHVMMTKNPPHQ